MHCSSLDASIRLLRLPLLLRDPPSRAMEIIDGSPREDKCNLSQLNTFPSDRYTIEPRRKKRVFAVCKPGQAIDKR